MSDLDEGRTVASELCGDCGEPMAADGCDCGAEQWAEPYSREEILEMLRAHLTQGLMSQREERRRDE